MTDAESKTDFDKWSAALALAGAPQPKLADMIVAIEAAAQRRQTMAMAAVLDNGGEYPPDVMREIACLDCAIALLSRISDNVRMWPRDVQATIKGAPR